MTEKERTNVPPDFEVIIGAPYLVIKNPQQKNATKVARRFYIPFQPKPISKDSEYYTEILKIRNNIAELEDLLKQHGFNYELGSEDFETLVHVFARNNFHVNKSDLTLAENSDIVSISDWLETEVDSKIDKLLIDIVKATYGVDKQLVTFNSEAEATEFLNNVATVDGEH